MLSARPILVLTLALASCSSANEPVKVDPATLPTASNLPSASSHVDPTKLPASHPPIRETLPSPKDSGALKFSVPEGWTAEPVKVQFRREQYRLAHQGKDTDDALVIVSYLGPVAGTLAMNKTRWASQFSQPDGKASIDVAKVNERKLGTIDVVDFELAGTMNPDAMGGDPKTEKPGWKLMIGWLQAADGNYFVKIFGPEATVAYWEPSFRKFVDSAK